MSLEALKELSALDGEAKSLLQRRPPLRVVFDRSARLPLDGQLARTARELPVLAFTDGSSPEAEAALRAVGVEIVVVASAGDALRQTLCKLQPLSVSARSWLRASS